MSTTHSCRKYNASSSSHAYIPVEFYFQQHNYKPLPFSASLFSPSIFAQKFQKVPVNSPPSTRRAAAYDGQNLPRNYFALFPFLQHYLHYSMSVHPFKPRSHYSHRAMPADSNYTPYKGFSCNPNSQEFAMLAFLKLTAIHKMHHFK